MGSVLIKTSEPHYSNQELRYEFNLAKHYRQHHDGLLPVNAFWRHLEHRWSIDPARFEHYHPIVGRWIDENYILTNQHTITNPPPPPPIRETGVPEPMPFVLLLIGITFVGLMKRLNK
jgi:hypothetical protein